MNGIIYCRVSSKEQAHGTSLESQEQACREYARSKNIKIIKVFVERGESAKFSDRTQLLELLDYCKKNKGKVQTLIVWKVDRFARNVSDHFNIKATLMKYGVDVVSVTEPIDSKPEGKLMETILAGFAQFDNDIRTLRSIQGMARKIQEGIYPWKAPLGYTSARNGGGKKTEPDKPNQPLFGMLQKAWREYATGTFTKAEIRRLMSGWGVRTRRGKPLSPQSVDEIFSNKFYAGIIVDPWSGKEYKGQHIPMVSPQTFAKVQKVISKSNASVPHQKQREDLPLRGLIRCRKCRSYLTASFSKGRSGRYAYYRCYKSACTLKGKSLPAPDLHRQFSDFLKSISATSQAASLIRRTILKKAESLSAGEREKRVRREKAIQRLKDQIQELIKMRTQGLLTDQEFLAQKSTLSEKLIDLESQHDPDLPSKDEISRNLDEVMEPLTDLAALWKNLTLEKRQRFQRYLLPVGFVDQKVGTAELGSLFKVIREFSSGKSDEAPLPGKTWNQIIRELSRVCDILGVKYEEKEVA